MSNIKKNINPKAQAKFRQGLALHEKGQLAQAHSLYEQALNIDADHSEAIHHLGIISLQSNDYVRAIALIEHALTLSPENPAALNNLGMALEDSQQAERALEVYDRALAIDPSNIDATINRGNVLQTLQRWQDALSCYDSLIARIPKNADPHNNRGNVLLALKQYTQAIESFDQAISLKSVFPQAWNNRGIALKALKQYELALHSFDRAITMLPNYAEAYSNRGIVFKELKQFYAALQNFDQAITLKPSYAQAYGNRAGLHQQLKHYDLAYQDYNRAIELNPRIPALHGKRLHVQMHLCEWSDFENRLKHIKEGIELGQPTVDPFTLLGIADMPELQIKAAEITVASDYPENAVLGPFALHKKNKKIRIGYFSADLRNHPVSYLMVDLFEKHDKTKFEIYIFNLGQTTKDPMQARIAAAAYQFFEVGHQTDLHIATLARSLSLDIAVDLGGFTIDNRPGIFALRAAPVQLGYIGYLGTMGANYYDYIIADQTLIPEQSRAYYSENIIYLNSYQANDSQRKISEKIFTREELGLPVKGFVFCCFNNNYKFTPVTFDSWMRILLAVPQSVLYLYADQEIAQRNLRDQALLRGVDPDRLIFGTSLPREEYLARYKTVDLFLDTLPYNAGTTASDALWAGLPVLTCAGKSLASRMAASLLTAIELPELITYSYPAYETLAIKLATDHLFYGMLKEKLHQNISTAALFNSDLFCADIEKAYLTIHTETLNSQRSVQ